MARTNQGFKQNKAMQGRIVMQAAAVLIVVLLLLAVTLDRRENRL